MKKLKFKPLKNLKNKCNVRIKEKGIKNFIWTLILCGMIAVASLCLIFALFIIISAPEFDKDMLYSKEATVLYDKDGVELARIGTENRVLITYDDLPRVFIDALVATEDSRFFQHNGLDIARFLKASMKQMMGSNEGGASTLSMQLIKKTYTSSEAHGIKGIIRKFTDIYMSVFKLESCYTKEEIIEFYSNSLWFGHDGNLNYNGIYGVEQASQFFFNKSISELSLSEASLLVGMYQNPVLYNPYRNPEGCKNRQRTVLKLMVAHGYISQKEMDVVLAIPIESLLADYQQGQASVTKYQATIDYIIDEVIDKTGKDPRAVSMKIYTTINSKMQAKLEKVENGDVWKWHDDFDQEGIAITSAADGSIAALSGGRNYQARGLNRATDINRQPGSTAKPIFDYAPYLEFLNGSTGDYFFDEPYSYSNGTPIMDADNKYQGMITMRQSLVGSRNITALQIFQKVAKKDLKLIEDFAHSFGINYGEYLYESASIGGFNGLSPLEMSAAYGTFARGGYFIEPYSFTKVVYDDGTEFEYKYTKKKVVSEETCYMITSMLEDAVKDGWSGNVKVSGTTVAGKTGTTDIDDAALEAKGIPLGAINDSWSVTYSPDYCIALWYGYDELTKEHYMNTTVGWKARSVIMASLANSIYPKNSTFKKPSGVVQVTVEKYTIPLQLPSEYTPSDMKITELFKAGTEPTEVSSRFSKIEAPTGGRANVSQGQVTLTWNNINTPDAINSSYLQKYFNDNYGTFASRYYESRLSYNSSTVGGLVYDIYIKDAGGLTKVSSTSETSYTQTIDPSAAYTFVVKAAYSNYKDNQSEGLVINVSPSADSPISESSADSTEKTEKDKNTNNNGNHGHFNDNSLD